MDLEQQIAAANQEWQRLAAQGQMEAATKSYARFARLHQQRSRETVLRMERARGLR